MELVFLFCSRIASFSYEMQILKEWRRFWFQAPPSVPNSSFLSRDLLRTLTPEELQTLERALSSQDGAPAFPASDSSTSNVTTITEYRNREKVKKTGELSKNLVSTLMDNAISNVVSRTAEMGIEAGASASVAEEGGQARDGQLMDGSLDQSNTSGMVNDKEGEKQSNCSASSASSRSSLSSSLYESTSDAVFGLLNEGESVQNVVPSAIVQTATDSVSVAESDNAERKPIADGAVKSKSDKAESDGREQDGEDIAAEM